MSVSINSAYGHFSAGTTGPQLHLPVSPSSLLYSPFHHVSGLPATNGQNRVSISKIQILNTIIEYLSSIKAGKTPAAMKSTSPDEINSLIENYQTQIRQAVAASQNSLYGIAGARPEAGVLFSFDA